jgi:hypothetical protein
VSRRTWRLVGAALVLAILLPAGSAASSPFPSRPANRFDLTSSAQPTAAAPVRSERAVRAAVTWAASPKTDAVATTSALCDGCRGDARTVQVLWAGSAWSVRADNAAIAWASCHSCGGTAVSVQLVLTPHPVALQVNNRALAVNVGCEGCDVAAEAYQLVVMTPHRPPLDRLRRQLSRWVEQLGAGVSAAPSARRLSAAAVPAGDVDDLGRLVTGSVGGTVLKSSVQQKAAD